MVIKGDCHITIIIESVINCNRAAVISSMCYLITVLVTNGLPSVVKLIRFLSQMIVELNRKS